MLPATVPTVNQEWHTLQNNIEQYEKNAQLIKLAGVVLCVVGLMLTQHALLTGILVSVLWLQEGIFRTFQSRLVERILRVERLIQQSAAVDSSTCQLHSEWRAGRPTTSGLLKEYFATTLRPTVAFPYVVLITIATAMTFV